MVRTPLNTSFIIILLVIEIQRSGEREREGEGERGGGRERGGGGRERENE